MPRRKPGTLLPIETEILEVALGMVRAGQRTFHGFGLAEHLQARDGSRSLTAHGTLYKALGRLEERGLLTSTWEAPEAGAGRPRRRLYEVTPDGAEAVRGVGATTAAAPTRTVGRPTRGASPASA